MSTETLKTRRRGLRWIVLPTAFAVAAVGVWAGVWMSIRAEVERQFDVWLKAEAAVGREHRCPERSFSGFPFRIEVMCRQPVVQMRTPNGMVEARFAQAIVTALIYRPDHVIADFTAPMTVSRPEGLLASLDFLGAQASLSMRNEAIERLSIVIERPSLSRSDNSRPELAGQNLEIHARPAPASSGGQDYDLALQVRGLGPAGTRPEQGADLNVLAAARGIPAAAPDNPSGILAAWAKNGGVFELGGLRLTRGSGVLGVNGRLGFNERGLAQGGFEAVVADSGALLSGLSIPGFGDLSLVFGPALTLVGRSGEIEGKRGTKVDVKLDNGLLSVGAVQIAEFAPVF